MRRSEGKSEKREAESGKQIPHTARRRRERVRDDRFWGGVTRNSKSESEIKAKSKSRSLTPLAKGASGFGMTALFCGSGLRERIGAGGMISLGRSEAKVKKREAKSESELVCSGF